MVGYQQRFFDIRLSVYIVPALSTNRVSLPNTVRDFLFAETSIPDLKPTKPRVQRIPRDPFEGSNRPGREAARSLPFIAEVKKKYS